MNATEKSELPQCLGGGVVLALRFSSRDEGAELLATFFRDKRGNEVRSERNRLGYWRKSLRALCIALLLAKVSQHRSRNAENSEFEIASADDKETWIWRLAQSLEQQAGWRAGIFGGPEKAKQVVCVRGGRKSEGTGSAGNKSGKLPKPATAYYNCGSVPLDRLMVYVGVSPDLTQCEKVNNPAELLALANLVKDQVPEWKEQSLPTISAAAGAPALAGDALGPSASEDDKGRHAAPVGVSLAVSVWKPDQGCYRRLNGSVLEGDLIRLEVELMNAAYLWIAWIDQSGGPWSILPKAWAEWPKIARTNQSVKVRIPDVPDDVAGELATKGPAGLETIVAMVRRELPAAELLSDLPMLLKTPNTHGKQWLLKAPVVARLSNEMKAAQRMSHTRTPVVSKTPAQVERVHQALAERLMKDFDEIWVCTFANLGPKRRLR